MNKNKDHFEKFDAKSDDCAFGYSTHSKAYRIFNTRTLVDEEFVHVTFDELNSLPRYVLSDDVEQSMGKLTINRHSSESSQKEKDEHDTPSTQQGVNEGLPNE